MEGCIMCQTTLERCMDCRENATVGLGEALDLEG